LSDETTLILVKCQTSTDKVLRTNNFDKHHSRCVILRVIRSDR